MMMLLPDRPTIKGYSGNKKLTLQQNRYVLFGVMICFGCMILLIINHQNGQLGVLSSTMKQASTSNCSCGTEISSEDDNNHEKEENNNVNHVNRKNKFDAHSIALDMASQPGRGYVPTRHHTWIPEVYVLLYFSIIYCIVNLYFSFFLFAFCWVYYLSFKYNSISYPTT